MNVCLTKVDVDLLSDAAAFNGVTEWLRAKIASLLVNIPLDNTLNGSQRHNVADIFRDTATSLEWIDLYQSQKLMLRALYFRPDGPFLKKKVQEYGRYIDAAESGECEVKGIYLSFPKHPPSPLLQSLVEGSCEHKEAELLTRFIEPDDRVLELGAGIGFMGVTAMMRCNPASYTAFEANPALLPFIAKNMQHNDVVFNVKNAVLLDKPGLQAFYVTPAFWGSSLLQPAEGYFEQVEVPALEKNSVIAELAPTTLIVDIEGGEAAFFRELDLTSVRKIIVEIHPMILGDDEIIEIFNTLISQGFLLDFKASGKQELFWCRSDSKVNI